MNEMTSIGHPPLHERDFVLATDLDGTFLGGSDEDRAALYDWIEDNRATIGLIFVTGRDPEFIADIFLCPYEACRIRLVSNPTYNVFKSSPRLVSKERNVSQLSSGFVNVSDV